jgi:hypothetical protein
LRFLALSAAEFRGLTEGDKPDGKGIAKPTAVVCCDCDAHLYWVYFQISLSLQRIRGPCTTMAAALVIAVT